MKCEKCGREYDGVYCPGCGEKGTQHQQEQFFAQEQTNVVERPVSDFETENSAQEESVQSSSVNGFAVASMAFGIISIISIVTGLLAVIFGILAIAFNRVSKKNRGQCTMATAGFVTGLIGLIIGAIISVIVIICVSMFTSLITSQIFDKLM